MPYLSIEVVYRDEHLLKILIKATNGRFAGRTQIYLDAGGGKLIDLGNRLLGFPKTTGHTESFEFGFTDDYQKEYQKLRNIHPDVKKAGAYLGLKFYCVDRMGHTAVFVSIREDSWSERPEMISEAGFEMRFEPSQIDKFVREVIDMGNRGEGTATLHGINHD